MSLPLTALASSPTEAFSLHKSNELLPEETIITVHGCLDKETGGAVCSHQDALRGEFITDVTFYTNTIDRTLTKNNSYTKAPRDHSSVYRRANDRLELGTVDKKQGIRCATSDCRENIVNGRYKQMVSGYYNPDP